MGSGKYLFTSESVSMGHPDKLADQISDGVLDACSHISNQAATRLEVVGNANKSHTGA